MLNHRFVCGTGEVCAHRLKPLSGIIASCRQWQSIQFISFEWSRSICACCWCQRCHWLCRQIDEWLMPSKLDNILGSFLNLSFPLGFVFRAVECGFLVGFSARLLRPMRSRRRRLLGSLQATIYCNLTQNWNEAVADVRRHFEQEEKTQRKNGKTKRKDDLPKK